MGSRYLGYLTDRRLALYEARNFEWEPVREFEDTQAAGELADCLHRDKPLHLLADVVEMEFRFEQVPFLRGRDRQSLHHRKLSQAFRASPYRHAFPLGRAPGRRGEEKLLLSAITNPELVEPWVSPLRQRRLPLSGIASVPVLQSLLAASLAADNPHLLLVTAQGRGHIRITYFFQQEMRFSRLAAHPDANGSCGQLAFEEVVRTHQYLLGLRLVDRASPVDVASLLPEELIGPWQAVQPSGSTLKFRHVGLPEAVQLAGIRGDRAAESTEDLFIGLLLKSRFPNHFAPAGERRHHQLFQARRAFIGASGLAAAAATAATAALLYGVVEKRQETRLAETAVATIKSKAEQVRRSFPATSAPTAEIREALALVDSLTRESAPSRRLLADISRGFDAVAQAELDRLAWVRTTRPESISGEDPVARAQAPLPPPEDGVPRPPRWVAVASGHIVGAADYREANAATDALADAIRRNGIQVDILRHPLNVRPDSELKEEMGTPVAPRQPFLLRVLWEQ